MRRRLVCAAVALACGLTAATSAAQSLADVARQEEARRKTTKKAVKSFTNADLGPAEAAAAPAAAPVAAAAAECFTSAKDGKCVPAEEVVANSQEGAPADPQVKTSEATIRQRADAIRQRLAKVQKEFDTVNATANDESRSPGERAAAARMASQRDGMLASIEEQWQGLEKQVADEELPREWLGVTPIFSRRIPR